MSAFSPADREDIRRAGRVVAEAHLRLRAAPHTLIIRAHGPEVVMAGVA